MNKRIMKFYFIYFTTKSNKQQYSIIENTYINYFHLLIAFSGLYCCITNRILLTLIFTFILASSMTIKNILFAFAYRSLYFKNYMRNYKGYKYSFTDPRTLIFECY